MIVTAVVAAALGASVVAPMGAGAIVGGNAALRQYGAVSLWSVTPHRHRCAAALITERWALTSAHCDVVMLPGETSVRASSRIVADGDRYEELGLAAAVPHPNFDRNLLRNDLALLRLARPARGTRPLALSVGRPAVDAVGRIAGWGWTCQGGGPGCDTTVTSLHELGVKVATPSRCPFMWQPSTEFCTISGDGSLAMACFGDSGSPWVTKGASGAVDDWVLRGIVGYDGDDWDTPPSCASNVAGTPGTGVVEDVATHLDWINDTIIRFGDAAPAVAR